VSVLEAVDPLLSTSAGWAADVGGCGGVDARDDHRQSAQFQPRGKASACSKSSELYCRFFRCWLRTCLLVKARLAGLAMLLKTNNFGLGRCDCPPKANWVLPTD